MTVDYYVVVEREHELQNPTSAEKIVLLGERLRLSPDVHVLDVASGRGGPALLLAREFGCRVTGVEVRGEFVRVARERIAAAGLDDRVEILHGDASEYPLEPDAWQVAMCLGASFVWGGLDATIAALGRAIRPGGGLVVGEPYWREWPLPADLPDPDDAFTTLAETARRFDERGFPLEALIASSEDDWDRYESLHWRAAEEWLAENRDHEDAATMRSRYLAHRDRYLRWERDLLGWAIFVSRKPLTQDTFDERGGDARGGAN